nr:MAG TPA: hypothetical protein [Caudoviricetes sp.]
MAKVIIAASVGYVVVLRSCVMPAAYGTPKCQL